MKSSIASLYPPSTWVHSLEMVRLMNRVVSRARTHTSYTRDDAQLDTLVFGDGANHLELVMPAAPSVEVDVNVPQREQQ
jgi:hypothetical protein